MPPTSRVAPDDFAHGLRRAVEASGLGLESIQRRLTERGVTVSVATLSYWQTGARFPGRRSSVEVVAHLEAVLGLEPRSLRSLVPAPRPRGLAAPPREEVVPRFTTRDAVRRIADTVRRPDSMYLTRISQHDVVTVGPQRRIDSVRIRTVARADADGVDGIGVTQFFDDETAGVPWLTVHSGATIRARHIDPRHKVIGAELRFAEPLRRGDTVVLDYEITADGPGPADTSYDACCALPIREYVLLARFRPDDPPEQCEGYRIPCRGAEVRRRVAVDPLAQAHLVVLDSPPGTVGLSWTHPG
ncbi:hypothetical protein [Nocardioides sp.]|uniref:hypothetical protein n=1 Tax=Nocardioides sp. TaxID=35761 RepID=UPI002735CE68|nr:hypothetical protein [Nocardioides sp.]MDP3892814.1 hypothetical protein [Nocardioides sp.]